MSESPLSLSPYEVLGVAASVSDDELRKAFRKALREINFYGWVAAEVGGGDAAELKHIAEEMDMVFGLV